MGWISGKEQRERKASLSMSTEMGINTAHRVNCTENLGRKSEMRNNRKTIYRWKAPETQTKHQCT